jgi:CarD family transcriptional regulator
MGRGVVEGVDMFAIGDMVVHPTHGAGKVVSLDEYQVAGADKQYYKIEPLAPSDLTVMVPIDNAERIGLRAVIAVTEVDRLLAILSSDPETLPDDHNRRREFLEAKLRQSDAYLTAEVVRDLIGRQQEQNRLTEKGSQLLERGIQSLAGEIAATSGADLSETTMQIWARLDKLKHIN